jgi:hypothetical protein
LKQKTIISKHKNNRQQQIVVTKHNEQQKTIELHMFIGGARCESRIAAPIDVERRRLMKRKLLTNLSATKFSSCYLHACCMMMMM